MKINYNDASIKHLMIHGIGSKCLDEALVLSSSEVAISDVTERRLLVNLLRRMPVEPLYHFSHDIELPYNEVFSLIKSSFETKEKFLDVSKMIAKHLFNQGVTKKIDSGLLYVAYLKHILIDDQEVDAIGIFKSEKLEMFLKLGYSGGEYSLASEKGIGNISKGCLIVNIDSESGYLVSLLNTRKKSDVKYWNEDFLGVKLRNDDYNRTNQIIELCGSFITSNEAIAKKDKAGMIDQVLSAMTIGDTTFEKIADTVFKDKTVKEQFLDFRNQKSSFADENLNEHFSPTSENIEKQLKKYRNKSKLILDDDFEVLIKNGDGNIVRGYDEEKGLSYYKLYFRDEK